MPFAFIYLTGLVDLTICYAYTHFQISTPLAIPTLTQLGIVILYARKLAGEVSPSLLICFSDGRLNVVVGIMSSILVKLCPISLL